MLNELVVLERGLAATEAAVAGRHPDVKDMAKSGAVRIRLAESGAISGLEIASSGGRGALWTLRDGQQNGFPGLKTAAGLLDLDDDARATHDNLWKDARSPKDKRAELQRLIDETPRQSKGDSWPKPGHRDRIRERLAQLLSLANDPRTAAVPAVFERFLRALDGSPPLLASLTDALTTQVRGGDETWLDVARAAFVGSVALAFDVPDDDGRFERDAGDSRQIAAVSAALGSGGSKSSNDDAMGECAFGETSGHLLGGNWPQPNLPGLGQTYLFARNQDIPAMTRYGRTGAQSMPISADLAARLSGAILSLTSDERQGKTWRLIPAEVGDKPDLFIASLASDMELPLAGEVAGTEEAGSGWSEVEISNESVLANLLGKANSANPQEQIRLLVLRTIDPANRKAIYDRRAQVSVLHDAARSWDEATRNAPDWIAFQVATKKGMRLWRPSFVSPLSVIPLSRTLFANGGQRRVNAVGISAGDTLSLFLRDGDSGKRSRRILRLLLQRHTALLVGLAQAKLRGRDDLKAFDPKTDLRRDALRSASWLGALLHYLGRFKENYMQDTAFKLGQLLAAADAVHIGYCADVRGGNTPPTLLGNAVFAIAGRTPLRALDILSGRWKPYGAWAQRKEHAVENADKLEKEGKNDRAKNIREGLSSASTAAILSEELEGALTPGIKPDEVFRAELLLGYVAGVKPMLKKEQKDGPNLEHDKRNDDENKGGET